MLTAGIAVDQLELPMMKANASEGRSSVRRGGVVHDMPKSSINGEVK